MPLRISPYAIVIDHVPLPMRHCPCAIDPTPLTLYCLPCALVFPTLALFHFIFLDQIVQLSVNLRIYHIAPSKYKRLYVHLLSDLHQICLFHATVKSLLCVGPEHYVLLERKKHVTRQGTLKLAMKVRKLISEPSFGFAVLFRTKSFVKLFVGPPVAPCPSSLPFLPRAY